MIQPNVDSETSLDVIENMVIIDDIGLDFSQPDTIIGQNHVHNGGLLCTSEHGAPSILVSSTLNPM